MVNFSCSIFLQRCNIRILLILATNTIVFAWNRCFLFLWFFSILRFDGFQWFLAQSLKKNAYFVTNSIATNCAEMKHRQSLKSSTIIQESLKFTSYMLSGKPWEGSALGKDTFFLNLRSILEQNQN